MNYLLTSLNFSGHILVACNVGVLTCIFLTILSIKTDYLQAVCDSPGTSTRSSITVKTALRSS
jgi:hypothetical protein